LANHKQPTRIKEDNNSHNSLLYLKPFETNQGVAKLTTNLDPEMSVTIRANNHDLNTGRGITKETLMCKAPDNCNFIIFIFIKHTRIFFIVFI